MSDGNNTNDTSPERQAYGGSGTEGFKGRLSTNVGNVRLFKDNPYIRDLPDADRLELNKELMTPRNGELFIDDDGFQWHCLYEEDTLGVVHYKYVSREKDLYEKMKFYESKGIFNQIMAAYNNGQVYKFYFNRSTLEMFPNTAIVFPEDYYSYTVRTQHLNEDNNFVFVAGNLVDGQVIDVHIGMKTIVDTVNGTSYKRMGPAKIFANGNSDRQFDQIQNNEFYVVEFYNENGEIVDKKLFQAVEAIVTNTQVPSASVVDLRINVFRNNVAERSADNIYPLIAGEDLTRTVSFTITAIYSDGTEKIITDKLDTDQLSREGWDVDTNGAEVGKQFPVTFTYHPFIDQDLQNTAGTKSKTIYFQVVANTYEKLYKVLPVMWMEGDTANNMAIAGRVYKFKLYTLSSEGSLENRTRAFWNTLQKVIDNQLANVTDCKYTFDSLNGCLIFVFPNNATNVTEITASFKIYDNSVQQEYRIILNFGQSYAESKGIFIKAYNGNNQYGYDPASGVLRTLKDTYKVENDVLLNKALLNYNGDGGYSIRIGSHTDEPFSTRYARSINGSLIKPNRVQFYSVKDETVTPITGIFQFSKIAGTPENPAIEVPTIKEDGVSRLIENIKSFDYLLAKFMHEEGPTTTLTDIDVFVVNKNGTGV